jgi:hypothetical protein
LPLDQIIRKLRAIETIWEDLARNEGQVKSPDWHFDKLKARTEAQGPQREGP